MSTRWNDNEDTKLHFLSLPSELLLTILSYLDVPEILALRQTCSALFQITHDTSLWMTLLRLQERDFPMPHTILNDSTTMESTVKDVYRVSRAWTVPRKQPPFKFLPKLGDNILRIEMFLDRWLLAVYTEGVIRLQDTSMVHSSAGSLEYLLAGYTLRLEHDKLASCTTYFDSGSNKVTLAITSGHGPPSITQVYEISLESERFDSLYNPFVLLKCIERPSLETVRAISLQDGLIVFSRSDVISLVDWHTANSNTTATALTTINTGNDELEDLWNGIVEVQFMGPYLLLFRTRSVELYNYLPLTDARAPRLASLKQEFSGTTFRGVSFSQVRSTTNDEVKMYTVDAIAFDVILGLFRYRITISVPNQSSAPPQLDMVLLGTFSMANQTRLASIVTASPGFNGGARGFISAHRLGYQGKRAVWVERKRGSTVREVQVWDHLLDDRSTESVEMEGKVIHKVVSYDLRDDIVHCTLGESTGRIVLGCRSGDIFVMNCI